MIRSITSMGGALGLVLAACLGLPGHAAAQVMPWSGPIYYNPYYGPYYAAPPVVYVGYTYPAPVVRAAASSGATTSSAYGAPTVRSSSPGYYSEQGPEATTESETPLDVKTAEIRVRLPARAQLFVNGKPTKLTGAVREFKTPELDPERVYTYRLRARWIEDGITVEKSLRVKTFAGNRVTVNFVRPAPRPPASVVQVATPTEAAPIPTVQQRPIRWTAPRSFSVPPY